MGSYPVKENPIGSAISEIIRHKKTDIQTNTHPVLYYKDKIIIMYYVMDLILNAWLIFKKTRKS